MTEIGAHIRRFEPLLFGLVVLPVTAVASAPIHGQPLHWLLAGVITSACFGLGLLLGPARGVAAWLAVVGMLAAALMFLFASYPGAIHVLAVPYGLALGLLVRRPGRARHYAQALAGAAVAALVFWWAPAVAVIMVAAGGVVLAASPGQPNIRQRPAATRLVAGLAGIGGLLSVAWVGSTAPAVTWFGDLTSHGPRDSRMVAITFDDGPNGEFTLEAARILTAHGAKGTFFEVGKAVKLEPDVTRKLISDGHLVGNHSYHHDAVSYLDPRYPELDQAESEIVAATGVCPALFRPPHGTHTPFMSQVVEDAGMSLITWDVSARDWVESDSAVLARHILEKVKPGSIILLHDGIDGNPGADRSVILQALPAILDGLQQRGLQPVTLDRLLNLQPYLTDSKCDPFRVSSGYTGTLPPDGVS